MEKSRGVGSCEAGKYAVKLSPWLYAGLAAILSSGLLFFLAGLFQPGNTEISDPIGESGKQVLQEVKKKNESLFQKQGFVDGAMKGAEGLKGSEGEHRVFVSSTLVYLPKHSEPVQPLDRKMVTDDGIEIGWKMRYGFDPADPSVRDQDPDGDGFTNLEEFLAGTDPLRKEDSPAKESKLKSRSAEPLGMSVSFPEKSGGSFTLRFQVSSKRKEFKGKPGDLFWIMAGPEGLEIFTDQDKVEAFRAKAKGAGQNFHVIPIRIVSYLEKIEKIKDAKAGGVEVEVDNSEILLQRKDALMETQKLIFSTAQRPYSLRWDVGEIRFYTPVGGGMEIGPFRMGETFTFDGKEFSIIDRDGMKIELLNREETGKKTFWVPPETKPNFEGPNP